MSIKDIEQSINKVKNVIVSKVVINEENKIQEIHIVSGLNRSPKQISRDVQTILISKFNLDIDYKKISIAQINEDSFSDNNIRLKLKLVECSVADTRASVKVILEKSGETFDGSIKGINTNSNILRMFAKATLLSIENYCGINDIFILEDVMLTMFAQKRVAVVAVTLLINNTEQLVIGSALVTHDENEAVVKATLDAVNRKLQKYFLDKV